ncbi:SusE domain-containing protein [uncultured Bacteroides sp.]|uniref:SusE domain-containing protein n=1 Tax=uncultured Bacteroides sp. TaxID=162156 RepID=UPI002AA6C6BB|nr:SusE domain-containing protein [uncultured Bacteroides sp.]
MKKINIYFSLLMAIALFSGCDSDRDSNPAYQQPDSFVLNTPAYAAVPQNLEEATSVVFTTTQPDYGFTAATTYAVQVSLTNDFSEVTENPVYQTLGSVSTSAKIAANAIELDKAIVKLAGWSTASQCIADSVIDVHVRLMATVADGLDPVYSNVVSIKVIPYYIELKDHAPLFYFLIGNGIGDSSWGNEWKNIGTSLVPLSMVPDYQYDKITGEGQFTITMYLEKATVANTGFKLIGQVDDAIGWGEQWGYGEDGDIPGYEEGKCVHLHNESGNPGHLGVSETGWYQVTVDETGAGTLKFEKLAAEPTSYASIQLMGVGGDWDTGVQMTNLGGRTPHSWYTQQTFAEDTEVKFRANAAWDVSWGGTVFPYAIGIAGGANIPVKAGTYNIVFNDVEGFYGFFEAE